MHEFVRVRDKTTGHEYSVRNVTENHEVLEGERAVDARGYALPATTTKTSGAKKAPAKKAAASSRTTGGEPATNPEEGSK